MIRNRNQNVYSWIKSKSFVDLHVNSRVYFVFLLDLYVLFECVILYRRELSIVDSVGTVDENVKQMCVCELYVVLDLELVLWDVCGGQSWANMRCFVFVLLLPACLAHLNVYLSSAEVWRLLGKFKTLVPLYIAPMYHQLHIVASCIADIDNREW